MHSPFGLILIWLKIILELVQIKRIYMLSSYEKIGFVLAVLIFLILSWRSFSIMIQAIRRGHGKLHFDQLGLRVRKSLSSLLLQSTVLTSRPVVSLIHSMVAWAFILYMLVNLGDVLSKLKKEILI